MPKIVGSTSLYIYNLPAGAGTVAYSGTGGSEQKRVSSSADYWAPNPPPGRYRIYWRPRGGRYRMLGTATVPGGGDSVLFDARTGKSRRKSTAVRRQMKRRAVRTVQPTQAVQKAARSPAMTRAITPSLFGLGGYGLGTGFDISHAGAPYQGMLGLGAEGIPMDTVSVRALQKLLLKKGFSVGPTGVDGIWGPNTKSGFNAACASNELLADKAFCKDLEVAPGKRYVKMPSVLHKAFVGLPDNPMPDPAGGRGGKPSTAVMPDLFDTGAEGESKVWPWVVGIGSGAVLLGGLWWWYQEQQGRQPVTPNRRRRRRRKR